MTSADASASSRRSDSHPGPPDATPVYDADASAIVDAIERARHPRSDELEALTGEFRNSILPALRLPGFGDREDNCGEFIPEAMHFCDTCYDVKQRPHNCMRHDCPDHAAHAARRRAAGSESNAGICPQLDALRRYTNAYFEDNVYFHHLFISPPAGFYWESDDPLKRGREVVRDILDELGIQGVVIYHPFRGEDEEHPSGEWDDDRGEWKRRMYHGRDWRGDVRDELEPEPHFHVIGVAPHVDISVTEEIEDETGWVIHRRADENGISIEDDAAMARAVTYALSHAGVYDAGDQRRLAAWMKGPDVNQVTPTARNKERMKAIVNQVSENTLGIPSPSVDCENTVPKIVNLNGAGSDDLPTVDRSRDHPLASAWEPDAITPTDTTTGGGLPHGSSASPPDAVAGMASAPTTLDDSDDDLGSPASSSTRPPSSADTSDDTGTDDSRPTCSGTVRHISVAGEYLLDGDKRQRAPFAEDLERAYRSYVDVMKAKNRDPQDGGPEIAEFRDHDPPPVD